MSADYNRIAELVGARVEKIPQIGSGTNFWMFRSKKGMFYHEFVREKFIAIGWNAITQGVLDGNNNDELGRIIKRNQYKDKNPNTAINKCRHFIREIQSGDIAVIVGETWVTFAKIGDYFEEYNDSTTVAKEKQIISDIDTGNYYSVRCPYIKRRHIEVISHINVQLLPPAMYRCIACNRHSLSNLCDYADAIISTAYDVAYYKNRLIIKYHIGQKRDINPIDFSLFILNISKLLENKRGDLVGKYNINSEGDVVLLLSNYGKPVYDFIRDNLVSILIINMIIFGGKGFGIEFNSAVEKVLGWVRDILSMKSRVRLEAANADKAEAETEEIRARAEKLREETRSIRLDNEKKRQQLEQEAREVVNYLRLSSEPLKIQLPSEELMAIIKEIYDDLAS